MFKHLALAFLFLFLPLAAFSQASIEGSILDSTQAPIPFAIVSLLNNDDSSLVKGTPADQNGAFVFSNLLPGNFCLKISAAGFADTYSGEIILDSITVYDAGSIVMKPAAVLNAFTVTAVRQTIEFKNGNIFVNVENSALSKGNSVYELLLRLPGVSVNNNTITMQGKSGVIVLIDGNVQQMSGQQLINILKGMSAENIQRIELLKNPPVKYDAAGTAGMINIVTKKSEQKGFSGTIYAESSQGSYNRADFAITLNYKTEKISVFTGIDEVQSNYFTRENFDRNFNTDSGHTEINNFASFKDLETGLNFKLGTDWYVNKKNTLGFKIDGGPGSYTSSANALNHVYDYNNTGFDHAQSVSYTPNKWSILNYNVNAEHRFDSTGTALAFSADFTQLNETDRGFSDNYFYDENGNAVLHPNIFRNTNQSATNIFSSRFDFTRMLDSATGIEAGIKGNNINATNNYLFEREDTVTTGFYTDPVLSNNYVYNEQTVAGYFNYSRTIRHLNLQLGIRAENTSVNGKNMSSGFVLKKKYSNLFPNVSLEYTRSENHNYQLNFSRRIDRPAYDQLNPFVIYRDQYSYFAGNPFLQPEYSYTAEFTYSFKDLLNNSISYSRITDFMLDYTTQNDSTKIFMETNKNIRFCNSLGYLLFVRYNPGSWCELSLNGNFSWVEYEGDIDGVRFRKQGINYSANLSGTFILPGKTRLEITGIYRGPNLYGIIQIDALWQASFAVKKSFFGEKLDCSVGMSDVFNTWKFHTHAKFDNQNWNFYHQEDTRRLLVSINYNFGRVKTEEREINSNEEEKNRLNH